MKNVMLRVGHRYDGSLAGGDQATALSMTLARARSSRPGSAATRRFGGSREKEYFLTDKGRALVHQIERQLNK